MEPIKLAYNAKQTEAREILAEPEVDELLFGGAKGGSKSVFGCQWLFEECRNIAEKYFSGVNTPKEPVQIAWMGRKVAKTFKETTFETWKRFIPKEYYTFKGDPIEIVILGRVKIITGGLDSHEDVEKFNSMELMRAFLDQAEETSREDVASLRSTFRYHVRGELIKGKILFTANPRQCWLKEEFIQNPQSNQRFLKSLYTDNPYIDQSDYEQRLRTAFSFRPSLLKAYLEGDWNAVEDPEQIIKAEWLNQVKTRPYRAWRKKVYLVCDCARFGDDNTVICLMENAEIKKKTTMPYCDATQIENVLNIMSIENSNCAIVIETVGADIGAAVSDYLKKAGRTVIEFQPAGAASERVEEKFGNLRAEAWHIAAEKLSTGILETEIHIATHNLDDRTITQLCAVRYKFKGNKLYVEEKAEIKKASRLGCSPDDADVYIMALWAYSKVPMAGKPLPGSGLTLDEITELQDNYR